MCPQKSNFWAVHIHLIKCLFVYINLFLACNKCLDFNKVCIYIGYEKA